MQIKDKKENHDGLSKTQESQEVFSSNCVRLSAYEWIFVTIAVFTVLCFGPALWERIEKFEPESDFRIPYVSGNDYWLYRRYCRWACSQKDILVVGDSVIWGHFVPRDKTISQHLNEISGDTQLFGKEPRAELFANLGLDGIHPAAMEGLLRYYGKDITNKNIILHFNPLWMSSPKQDLQSEKEFVFNHPKLVAQFSPKIPCYKASFLARISAVLRRYTTLPNLISHLNIQYYHGTDMPTWTIENPYKNPLKALTYNFPDADFYEKTESISQPKNNIAGDGYQWIMPETSFQWRCFRKTIRMLQKRKNRVFVLVGPFNEHNLGRASLESYVDLKKDIELWLVANHIDYYAPPALPAELYVDASHPTSEGYALLAQQLITNESFKTFILNSDPN